MLYISFIDIHVSDSSVPVLLMGILDPCFPIFQYYFTELFLSVPAGCIEECLFLCSEHARCHTRPSRLLGRPVPFFVCVFVRPLHFSSSHSCV